jgi:hypothetical protein
MVTDRPEPKGIETHPLRRFVQHIQVTDRPEPKGIETTVERRACNRRLVTDRPEPNGIETALRVILLLRLRSPTALNQKGLRQLDRCRSSLPPVTDRPEPKGIETTRPGRWPLKAN